MGINNITDAAMLLPNGLIVVPGTPADCLTPFINPISSVCFSISCKQNYVNVPSSLLAVETEVVDTKREAEIKALRDYLNVFA